MVHRFSKAAQGGQGMMGCPITKLHKTYTSVPWIHQSRPAKLVAQPGTFLFVVSRSMVHRRPLLAEETPSKERYQYQSKSEHRGSIRILNCQIPTSPTSWKQTVMNLPNNHVDHWYQVVCTTQMVLKALEDSDASREKAGWISCSKRKSSSTIGAATRMMEAREPTCTAKMRWDQNLEWTLLELIVTAFGWIINNKEGYQ